jgi:hypothetical protein
VAEDEQHNSSEEQPRRTFTLDFFPGSRASVSSTLTLIESRVITLKILVFVPIFWLAPTRKEGLFCVAEDEQHNSSEEAGGHFPFLHFQAALDSAREIQARLNTQGKNSSVSKAITGSPRRSLSLLAEPWPR